MAQDEDIPYSAPEFATPEPENEPDEDQAYRGVLLDVQKYLAEAIDEHNSFDVIDLTESAKMTPTQQIAMQKSVVHHLKHVKTEVDNKLKELA